MKNSKLRNKLGINARNFAKKEFNEKDIINQNIDVYKKLLK